MLSFHWSQATRKGVVWYGRGVVVPWGRDWVVAWNATSIPLNSPLLPQMAVYWSCKNRRI